MKKKMLFIFQLIIKAIIILLALSTFFIQKVNPEDYSENFLVKIFCLDHFYNSHLNFALFGILAIMLLLSVFTMKQNNKSLIFLHMIFGLALLVIIYDKSSNFRSFMPIMEGQELHLSEIVKNSKYDHSIKLNKFTIEYHEDSPMPSAFTSQLILDNKDTMEINVNKPGKIGPYRFYQNAYDKIPIYKLSIDDEEYEIAIDDTLMIKDHVLFVELTKDEKAINFNFDEQQIRISAMGGEFAIGDFNFHLSIDGSKYLSVIEVASVRGMRILLLLGISYLITLGYAFWRKK